MTRKEFGTLNSTYPGLSPCEAGISDGNGVVAVVMTSFGKTGLDLHESSVEGSRSLIVALIDGTVLPRAVLLL